MLYGIWDGGAVIGVFTAPITVRSNRPVFVSDTLSLSRKVAARSSQRWEIETAIRPESLDANALMVHLVTKGYSAVVQVLMPQNTGVINKRVGSNAVIASGGAGDTQVTVSSPGGLIPKGTFIRFANHSKIYMTTEDISGAGTVDIFPALRVAVVSQATSYRDDVIANMLYDTDVTKGMSYTDGMLMDPGVVRLLEAL